MSDITNRYQEGRRLYLGYVLATKMKHLLGRSTSRSRSTGTKGAPSRRTPRRLAQAGLPARGRPASRGSKGPGPGPGPGGAGRLCPRPLTKDSSRPAPLPAPSPPPTPAAPEREAAPGGCFQAGERPPSRKSSTRLSPRLLCHPGRENPGQPRAPLGVYDTANRALQQAD